MGTPVAHHVGPMSPGGARLAGMAAKYDPKRAIASYTARSGRFDVTTTLREYQ